jgi:hypothetical protein
MKSLDLAFYLDMKTSDDFQQCDRLVIQLESLKKCKYKLYKNAIVVLDEVNSLLSHLRSPTMNKKRRETYLYLVELIRNSKYVISMDCDLSDWNITFLQEIAKDDYIVYHNTIKNKTGTTAIIYDCPQTMIDIMLEQLTSKTPFIACFDSLKQMNNIIHFLSNYGFSKHNWLIYSSEVDYKLIDTKDWIDKFVFFTPSIIYGIDFSHKSVDVFSFTYKSHLNSLEIYQMISRARIQNKVHIYCNQRETYIKYKTIDDVIAETEMYEKNISILIPSYKNYIDIDDKPYRTMFYNHKYIDSIFKTNIKGYLINMLYDKGYDVDFNDTFIGKILSKPEKTVKNIKENILKILSLDKNNLSDLEHILVINDKALEKHFNLRLLINDKLDTKIADSIIQNLFIESLKSKYIKIKICKELMNVLEITDLQLLTKDITSNFTKNIDNNWLKENIYIIKKTFDIRTKKYDTFEYYNIYILLITLLKNLFDVNLFTQRRFKFDTVDYKYYILNQNLFDEHLDIMNKINKNIHFLEID